MESKTLPHRQTSKTCQNCKSKFIIEPEDFVFYKKIDVPEPTFCPECRIQRKAAFWNMVEMYKRKCDFSGKEIISFYLPESPYKIYDSKIWWSDKWNPMDYGKEYDFSKPFFKQFQELRLEVPKPHNLNINSVNCDYCFATLNCKNCYLCVGNNSENSAYSTMGFCKDSFDSYWLYRSEKCYENFFCTHSYNLHFSQYSDNCIDSAFLYDCRNCQNCFGCVNLRHKKYHIFNKSYTKEEYFKELKKYYLGSYINLEKLKKRFEKFKLNCPRKFARIHNSQNVSGDNIKDAKNCHHCYFTIEGVEDSKYIWSGGNNMKECYDVFDGGTNSELTYEGVSVGKNTRQIYFSIYAIDNIYDSEYVDYCSNSNNLFGCISLRHKKYCILNKQYTKKEYEKLISKIKKHMNEMPYIDKKDRIYKYGEFFPVEFSPIAYNKSIAYEYYPLSKKEALERGYLWYDKPKIDREDSIKSKDLPDDVKKINKSMINKIIECANTSSCSGIGAFRIIQSELEFYKKNNISLPRLCPDCRHNERIKQRNPMKLWKRKCMKKGCSNTFQTTYAPDRPEIVYCEKCYNKEVS